MIIFTFRLTGDISRVDAIQCFCRTFPELMEMFLPTAEPVRLDLTAPHPNRSSSTMQTAFTAINGTVEQEQTADETCVPRRVHTGREWICGGTHLSSPSSRSGPGSLAALWRPVRPRSLRRFDRLPSRLQAIGQTRLFVNKVKLFSID